VFADLIYTSYSKIDHQQYAP